MPFLYNKVMQLYVFHFLACYHICYILGHFFLTHVFQSPLLRTLEEFTISRQEKEEEKRRSRVCRLHYLVMDSHDFVVL